MALFAICLESSHQKGMGHLFRALNFISYLDKMGETYCIIINEDEKAKNILSSRGVSFQSLDINDPSCDWESEIIKKYNPLVWINDRLDTTAAHSKNVKKNNVYLVSFDDNGEGAEFADINFGLMPCNYKKNLKGKIVKRGIEYFILNDEINRYKRERNSMEKIIVTLGGSDTYGVTLKVVEVLKRSKFDVTIIVGPSFRHEKELNAIADNRFKIKYGVPSLIEEFLNYDIAITGGGITPFEANASGLPCIIIANEPHEVDNGKFLDHAGSSIFIGHHVSVDFSSIPFDQINIQKMSAAGLSTIHTNGSENIYNTIKDL